MKITIDTKEDSHEEIRKIIRMLSSLIREKEVFTNQPEINEEKTGSAFTSMFGEQPSEAKETETKEEPEVKEVTSDDIPKMMEY